jgi:hypothetical protein
MTIEEARMEWLLKMGSGWVRLRDISIYSDVVPAYKELLKTEFDFDAPNNTIKLKCKS